jgi:hypothetical protein
MLICLSMMCAVEAAHAQVFITASPQALAFTYQLGGPNPPAQNIYLSADVPSQFAVTISGAPWLTVSPPSGLAPSTLVATVNGPTNATPGTLTGTILIGPPASVDSLKTVVTVTLNVLAPAQGNLVVSPDNLRFTYQAGSPLPAPHGFTVSSTGGPASFNLATSDPWLKATTSSNVTPSTVQVNVLPNPAMPAGSYQGFVTVLPSYAGGTAQKVIVTLQIYSAGTLMASPNNLTFNYQPGNPIPSAQALNIVNSAGGAVSYIVTATTSNGGAWLFYSPGSGTTPSSIVVSVNPAFLPAGTYNGLITVAPTVAQNQSAQIPVTLVVYSTSQIVAAPASLSFNYQSGGPAAATQYISATSTGSPINYSISVQGPSWITTSPAGPLVTPSGFGVNSSPPAGTAAGPYLANIVLTPLNGGGTAITIPVTTNVASANYLTLGRTAVSFSYAVGGVNPPPVVVPVTSTSGSIRFQAVASTVGFGPWLNVHQSSQYTPGELTIGVAPGGLAAGTYTGNITVTSEDASNSPQSIAVTLVVTPATSLVASPFGLVFSYQAGQSSPAPQVFTLTTTGNPETYTLSATTTSGGNWLLAVGNGATPATVAVGVNPANLGPGTYTGQVQVQAADTSVPALQVPIVLNVAAGFVFTPGSSLVAFQYQTGYATPPSQTVDIATNTGDSGIFNPRVLTADGGTWLSVTPDIGVTPTKLTLSVNPASLAPGLYYAVVALDDTAAVAPTSFVPVTLQVANGPILGVPAQSLVFQTQSGIAISAAQQITVNNVGPQTQFQATTYGGTWLQANPAHGYSGSTIAVTVTTSGLAPGFYLGGVVIEIPGVPNSQQLVPVTLLIAPGFN